MGRRKRGGRKAGDIFKGRGKKKGGRNKEESAVTYPARPPRGSVPKWDDKSGSWSHYGGAAPASEGELGLSPSQRPQFSAKDLIKEEMAEAASIERPGLSDDPSLGVAPSTKAEPSKPQIGLGTSPSQKAKPSKHLNSPYSVRTGW